MSQFSLTTFEFAKQIRKLSLKMVNVAKASHIGSALSIADILAVLYNDVLDFDPLDPNDSRRDRFLLSKGHACVALYAALAIKGFFDSKELDSYSQDGSMFLSHTNHHVPGVEISAGSLGHALPLCCGLALAAKRKDTSWRTYCLISDGELDEGSNWEAILFAPQHNLDNLILVVDYNKIQSLSRVSDVISLEPLKGKFEAFGWSVFEVDGHDCDKLKKAFILAQRLDQKPKVIIANTTKGKGVSFMQDKVLWHYRSPNDEQYFEAVSEIDES